MANYIQISTNKTLKLTNVLIREVVLQENKDFNRDVMQMENYIKSKGAMPIGPVIQKTKLAFQENGDMEVKVYLLRQVSCLIHKLDEHYLMEPVLRVPNCVYAHYEGPDEKLQIAYDKIGVVAFEEDIILSDVNYTIFINRKEDVMIADVFVEKKTNE